MRENDFILTLYKADQTVFCLSDISMLLNESNFTRLKQKVNYYVHTNAISNIRRGIYAKNNYNKEELACKIYTPAYISLEFVLQKAGIIFQFNEPITIVSYLSRNILADKNKLVYRKIKNQVLFNTSGISRSREGVNIATPRELF